MNCSLNKVHNMFHRVYSALSKVDISRQILNRITIIQSIGDKYNPKFRTTGTNGAIIGSTFFSIWVAESLMGLFCLFYVRDWYGAENMAAVLLVELHVSTAIIVDVRIPLISWLKSKVSGYAIPVAAIDGDSGLDPRAWIDHFECNFRFNTEVQGFRVEDEPSIAGSVVRFYPPNADDGSITFHKHMLRVFDVAGACTQTEEEL
ncbi:hypothetical protein B0H13DRAFT_2274941 [Mycena leptocephala]|nr:hypothetical protein B0H13DRAFT_2274941 [Mycena leptocephala]